MRSVAIGAISMHEVRAHTHRHQEIWFSSVCPCDKLVTRPPGACPKAHMFGWHRQNT